MRRKAELPGVRFALVCAAGAAALALGAGRAAWSPEAATATPGAGPAAGVAVIVRAGTARSAAAAVRAAGGAVTRMLPLVDAVAARLPARSLPALREARAIRSVLPDRSIHPASLGECGGADPACYDALPPNTLWEQAVGLDRVPNKYKGDFVTVALLDTGVTPGPDIGTRLLARVDLTADGDGLDHLGHGSHMAGLIAGDGTQSFEGYEGAASEANLISVKVAGWDGATDVSTVIAGLQWIVANRDRYGIRVLSLSFGTDARQSVAVDPLNAAVQRVTEAGIFVVVSAGNAGAAGSVTKPGDDPTVLTVGAADVGTLPSPEDDTVAPFSSHGPTADGLAKPDVVAPGISIVSLRAPGSTADVFRPTARVAGDYFKGTGTSQAAAIVAGIAARMLEADPTLTPARLKATLIATARPLPGSVGAGAGLVDAAAAVRSVAPKTAVPIEAAAPAAPLSNGLGSIDRSRGSNAVVVDLDGDRVPEPLRGEMDALGQPWVAATFAATAWSADAWAASPWSSRVAVAPTPPPAAPPAIAWDARFWGASTWEQAGWDARFWGARFWGARFWGSDAWG